MPRESARNFPDAPQLGIGAATIINNSRITFSGAEGLVLFVFKLQVLNAAAVAVPQVSSRFVGSAILQGGFQGQAHSENVIGRAMSLEAYGFIRNPPVGSFAELEVVTTGGTVDVALNAGASVVLSFDAEDLGGPVVTVAT